MPELDEREEKAANMKLSDIGATVVNPVAAEAEEEDEEPEDEEDDADDDDDADDEDTEEANSREEVN